MSDTPDSTPQPELRTLMADTLDDFRELLEEISTEGKIRHIIGQTRRMQLRELRQAFIQGGDAAGTLRPILERFSDNPDDAIVTFGQQSYIPVEEYLQSLQAEYPNAMSWQLTLTPANQILCVEILAPFVPPQAGPPTEERPQIQAVDTVQVGESVRLELIEPPPITKKEFPIPTAQEQDILARSMGDGQQFKHWKLDPQTSTWTYAVPGSTSHYVQLHPKPEEEALGISDYVLNGVQQLIARQDADGILAVMYVSALLKPEAPLPPDTYRGKRIKIDDVIEKIGWKPLSTKQRQEMREQVWQYLVYGERAYVHGQRTNEFYDKLTKEVLSTRIDAPLWRLFAPERQQGTLYPALEVPLSIDIVLSKEWEALLIDPRLAQYLPLGEKLGEIPPNKPSGAWARVIGLALANAWRREPAKALNGIIKESRKALLTRYTPKGKRIEDFLSSKNPRRALEYWHEALIALVECGFLAGEGEAKSDKLESVIKTLRRKDWQEDWLNGIPDLSPGPLMQPTLKSLAAARPDPKPKLLKKARRRKGTAD